MVKVASGFTKDFQVFGNDWPTKDGTCIRDYIHIMDLAEAHIASLDYLSKEKSAFRTFNIGTGIGHSVLDLIKTFERVNKCKIPYDFVSRRKGDVAISVAKNDLAIRLLNWHPKRTLDDACIDGWKWQKKFITKQRI